MIRAEFAKSTEGFTRFSVSGHAGYADEGEDIVCAGVSSAVVLVLNLLEQFSAKGDCLVEENKLGFSCQQITKETELLIGGLYEHLTVLSEDYPKHISVKLGR